MSSRTLIIMFISGLIVATSLVGRQPFILKGPYMSKPTPKIPHRMEIHGDVRVDDYFWMRERDTPPVLDFLRNENARTEAALQPVAKLEKTLYAEMRSRVKEDDASVPVFDSGYWYYWRFEKGGEYPVHARKAKTLDAPEEVFLNENEASKGSAYFEVASAEISSDQNILAYAVDSVGRRIYDVHFKDLRTGKMLPDQIKGITQNIAWAEDNKTLFYVRQDPDTLRAYQLYRYELGSNQPELVFEEKDTTYNIGIGLAKTHRYLFLEISKRDSSEVRFLDAKTPRGEFKTFLPRENNHEYSLDDGGDRFYILTNWQARNFRVMSAPVTAHAKSEWKDVVPHDPHVFLEGVDVYAKHFVVSERREGLPLLAIHPRDGGEVNRLKFPDEVYEVDNNPLPDYQGTTLRFHYQSLVQPPSVFEEDVFTHKRELKKTREVPGYNPALYETKRIWAKSSDGTQVPISLVQQKSRKQAAPMLLYGYGSYGLSMDAAFRSSIFSLVDRGFVYAIAHIRGGSEMGREWYEQGRLSHKMNTFTDFISSAETLIQQGFTTKEHLHIMGGSAGGLLMGAVLNLRPDLFKSAIAAVPFVDVLTTMLDETIPLTTGEYKEWGDPRIKEQYGWMRKYSPYDNVERKAYPNILITTGYHDSQVQYWEPAKWLAKLREYKTDDHLLLMHTELEAGHSGASGRFEALKTLAKEYGFILLLEQKLD